MSREGQTASLQVRIAAVVLLLLMTTVVLEVALRTYQKVSRGVPFTTLFPEYRDTRHALSPFLVFGPRLDFQIEDRQFPELAYFDALGFRTNEPVGPKPPGEYRIIAVGGSTTENFWNEAGLHWPLALECSLREAGHPEVRVLNAGMAGYTTAHSLLRLQFDLLDYQPDMVIVLHNVNDLSVTWEAKDGVEVDGHYAAKYLLPEYVNVLRSEDAMLLRVWHSLKSRLGPPPPPLTPSTTHDLGPGRRYFERNLRAIDALVSERGATLVLVTMPFDEGRVDESRAAFGQAGMGSIPEEARFRADMDDFNQVILGLAASRPETMAVDMATKLAGADTLLVDVVHYSTEGVKRFGALLAEDLVGSIPSGGEGFTLSPEAVRRCAW